MNDRSSNFKLFDLLFKALGLCSWVTPFASHTCKMMWNMDNCIMVAFETSPEPDGKKFIDPKFYPLQRSLNKVKSLDDAVKIVQEFQMSYGADPIPPQITSTIFSILSPKSVAEALELAAQLKARTGLVPECATIARVIESAALSGIETISIARELAGQWQLSFKNDREIARAAITRCGTRDELLPTLFAFWDEARLPASLLINITEKVKSKEWLNVILKKIRERYVIVEVKSHRASQTEDMQNFIKELNKRIKESNRTVVALANIFRDIRARNPQITLPQSLLAHVISRVKKAELERPSFLLSELHAASGINPTNKMLAQMLYRSLEGNARKINLAAVTELIYILENSGISLEQFAELGFQCRVFAARYLMLLGTPESQSRGIQLLAPLLQEKEPSEHQMGAAYRLLARYARGNPLTIAVLETIKSKKILQGIEHIPESKTDPFRNIALAPISPVWTGLYDRPVNMKAVNQVFRDAME